MVTISGSYNSRLENKSTSEGSQHLIFSLLSGVCITAYSHYIRWTRAGKKKIISRSFSVTLPTGIKLFGFTNHIGADSLPASCTTALKSTAPNKEGRKGHLTHGYAIPVGRLFIRHSMHSWEGHSLTAFLSGSLWTQDVFSLWSSEKTSALLLHLLTLPFIGMNTDYLGSNGKWCAVNQSGQIGRDY